MVEQTLSSLELEGELINHLVISLQDFTLGFLPFLKGKPGLQEGIGKIKLAIDGQTFLEHPGIKVFPVLLLHLEDLEVKGAGFKDKLKDFPFKGFNGGEGKEIVELICQDILKDLACNLYVVPLDLSQNSGDFRLGFELQTVSILQCMRIFSQHFLGVEWGLIQALLLKVCKLLISRHNVRSGVSQ